MASFYGYASEFLEGEETTTFDQSYSAPASHPAL
jgi:hypothetical protein